MEKAFIFRTRPKKMDPEEFVKISRTLDVSEKLMESEEGLAMHDGMRSLVYSQPGTKFGGLLFFTDQSQSLGAPSRKLVEVEEAKSWAEEFLKGFDLLPHRSRDERISFKMALSTSPTNGIIFDGREKQKIPVNMALISRMTLNGIPVTGPRAKIRMAFKEHVNPILIHRGLWQDIEVYEDIDIVPEEEIAKAVTERLALRRSRRKNFRMVDIKLAYFADEFCAEPDLLAPFYFVEVAFADPQAEELGIKEGPRQMIQLPAYR